MMPRRLTNVDVQFISLVKKGANQEKITIFKSANYQEGAEGQVASDVSETTNSKANTITITDGENSVVLKDKEMNLPEEAKIEYIEPSLVNKFFGVMKNLFGGKEDIQKAKDISREVDYSSFNSIISSPRGNFSRALYILDDAVWHIFWDDTIENGKELILKNIDEFKAYVEGILNDPDDNVKKEFFQKSSDRIKKELEELTSVFNGTIGKIEKGVDAEVTKEELQELLSPITKSIEGLTDKVTALEASVKKTEEQVSGTEAEVAKKTEEVAQKSEEVATKKSEEVGTEIKGLIEEFSKSVNTSLADISGRLQKLEETRGLSNSQESTEVHKGDDDDPWTGVLFRD
jgi:hypothetical protein